MALLNNSNFYAYSYGNGLTSKKDEVDTYIDFLKGCNDYDEVKNYLIEHFGETSGQRFINFDECNKTCYINFEDNKIEFCSLKNHKQYYGKGWMKVGED